MDDVPWDMSPIPPPPSATEAIEEDLAFDANPALEIAVLETMEPKTGPELASQRLEAEPLPHQQHAVSTSSIPAETLNDVPGADQNKESSESLRSESASGSDSSSESSSSSGSSTSRSPSSLSSSSSSESSDDDNADSATGTTKGGSVYDTPYKQLHFTDTEIFVTPDDTMKDLKNDTGRVTVDLTTSLPAASENKQEGERTPSSSSSSGS
ncbi:zinc finger CCHC domain-containing protein 10-like [Eriocheir sinensis]|uniref:zinc finger CCHC domain-containing protein 10-like n=1 Tax=Eriocheir sinensis TaxID=95602 RepID=UPI0021C7EFFA|nr:zinc finger CCHC domain-containing protein 10-like [Eriocheir sinensis]